MPDETITINVRQVGDHIDVAAAVRAGRTVLLHDPEGVFPPFVIERQGAAFECCAGISYGLFRDPDDALRFGLLNRDQREGEYADSH